MGLAFEHRLHQRLGLRFREKTASGAQLSALILRALCPALEPPHPLGFLMAPDKIDASAGSIPNPAERRRS